MKPILLFIILLLFFSSPLFCQENSSQKSGVIQYEMKGLCSPSINSELHFSKKESIFIYNKIGLDKIQQKNSMQMGQKNEGITNVSISASPTDKTGNLTYRNFQEKQLILRFPNSSLLSSYMVQDKWNPWKWTIMDEHKKILGYDAQKAIAQFRGRIYIAWFTTEIPVPYGPWKLFGLPGLILEAYDTSNVVGFKVKRICYPCDEGQIDKPYEKERKTMKEHVYIHDYFNEWLLIKFNENWKKTGHKGGFAFGSPSTTLEKIKEKRESNFEKQYEWEDFPGDMKSPFGKTLVEKAYESIPPEVRDLDKKYRMQNQTLETFHQSILIEAEGN